jgi:spermidine/putrescine transport system permease protein
VRRSRVPLLATAVVLLFFYVPIAILAWQSFNAARYGGEWSGFTLRWYRELFDDRAIWLAVRNTLTVAISATVLSVVIGTAGAWALHRFRTPLQRLHYLLVYAPLVVPDILMGISLLLFYVSLGRQLGLATIIVAHVTFCISYVAFVVLGRLQDFDDAVIEAAQDLGARPWTIFTRIIIPVLAPGIVAGALLAFTLSVDDFVVTFFVSGPGSSTLPVHIYSMIRHGSTTVINALSVLFMAVSFTLAIVSQVILRDRSAS